MLRSLTCLASGAVAAAALAAPFQAVADTQGRTGSHATPAALTAVIDAGSSGSRIYLYEGRATNRSVDVSTQFEASPDTVPGLSSFRRHPARAGTQGVGHLLDLLGEYLAKAGIDPASVPTHVLATAGMRNVQREAPRAVGRIYASVREAIAAAGLPVGRVGTISGRSEGLYSWTDVNYPRGAFGRGVAPRGIVEVGGASAQVARGFAVLQTAR